MSRASRVWLEERALLARGRLLFAQRPMLVRHTGLSQFEQRGHIRDKLHGLVDRKKLNGVVQEEEIRLVARVPFHLANPLSPSAPQDCHLQSRLPFLAQMRYIVVLNEQGPQIVTQRMSDDIPRSSGPSYRLAPA